MQHKMARWDRFASSRVINYKSANNKKEVDAQCALIPKKYDRPTVTLQVDEYLCEMVQNNHPGGNCPEDL